MRAPPGGRRRRSALLQGTLIGYVVWSAAGGCLGLCVGSPGGGEVAKYAVVAGALIGLAVAHVGWFVTSLLKVLGLLALFLAAQLLLHAHSPPWFRPYIEPINLTVFLLLTLFIRRRR